MTTLRKAAQQALAYIEDVDYGPYDRQPVIDALRAALAEQDSVAAWENKYEMKEWHVHAIRAGWMPAPTPRQWVGLTDAELAEFSDAKLGSYDLCLEVEAKLKEKNT